MLTSAEEAILTYWPRGCTVQDDNLPVPIGVPIGGDDDEPVCDPPCGEFQVKTTAGIGGGAAAVLF